MVQTDGRNAAAVERLLSRPPPAADGPARRGRSSVEGRRRWRCGYRDGGAAPGWQRAAVSQLAAGRCGLGKQRWGCERRLLVALQLTQWLCASCADWPAPAQWPPGGHGPPRGRAAARTRPRCAALTRRRATCPSRLWRLSAWIRRERRRTVEPQLRARKVVCTPTFDSAAGSGEIPAFFSVSDHI